ncbi:FadR/GntR family transcriptional regulator [Virgibacillus halophilus]|uniref:GntR family transcriptional regulator n=1 Tax=Tigheibacillus halophilus TaxID=361280 RepID=A0ABU5CC94_9BACI|nr:GntR family transcriptional regulator [Virgibacillus halophilus]
MAVTMSPKQKVYQEVLQEIRTYIDENHLQTGDKLPSERDLSEKLHAGRSSVREALRAMELLGLIETRRGEGTFLTTYQPYQSVELLSSFILRKDGIKDELFLTRAILEKEVAKIAFRDLDEQDLSILEGLLQDDAIKPEERHLDFFGLLFSKINNLLLAKIWGLIEAFSLTAQHFYYDEDFYHDLLSLYKHDQYDEIEDLFHHNIKIRN